MRRFVLEEHTKPKGALPFEEPVGPPRGAPLISGVTRLITAAYDSRAGSPGESSHVR
jgi:hypothetical protein